jgi:hypothetical protein
VLGQRRFDVSLRFGNATVGSESLRGDVHVTNSHRSKTGRRTHQSESDPLAPEPRSVVGDISPAGSSCWRPPGDVALSSIRKTFLGQLSRMANLPTVSGCHWSFTFSISLLYGVALKNHISLSNNLCRYRRICPFGMNSHDFFTFKNRQSQSSSEFPT